MFGTVKLVINEIKSKFIYDVREIVFDWEGWWIFNNDSSRNVVDFGVDNSSSSHTNNQKVSTFAINDSHGAAEKNLGLTLVKQIQILFKFTAILCKADPDPDPDLKNKQTLDV